MNDSIYLLTPEDKNFISHVCRNLQTFSNWVQASEYAEDFDVEEARKTSADYLLSELLDEYHLELTDKEKAVRILAHGTLAQSDINVIDVIDVIKEVALLLDTYTASLS